MFLSKLGETGVPAWWVLGGMQVSAEPYTDCRDFDAPQPAPYDASAGCIAARGLQMIYQLLQPVDPAAAEEYLFRGNKLIADVLRECLAPEARVKGGRVDWGEGGWEPILMVSGTVYK